MASPFSRRSFLGKTAVTATIASTAASLHHRLQAAEEKGALKGRINHSVCKWCYPKVGLKEFCEASKEIGLTSIDLLQPADMETLKPFGLTCAMISNPETDGPNGKKIGGISRAWNRVEHHDKLVEAYEAQIDAAAKLGLSNVICFSGNRDGQDDEVGLQNCAKGLKRLMKRAEEKKVVLTMELLNSKVNHPDYQCDHTSWGVALCKLIGSDHFKLLYDIYHMQIMEGDVIATIRSSHPYISHYHTGGVPGRNEIDESQELYYPAIMEAVVATGFKGFVAQEFIPKREDVIASLQQGVEICDI